MAAILEKVYPTSFSRTLLSNTLNFTMNLSQAEAVAERMEQSQSELEQAPTHVRQLWKGKFPRRPASQCPRKRISGAGG